MDRTRLCLSRVWRNRATRSTRGPSGATVQIGRRGAWTNSGRFRLDLHGGLLALPCNSVESGALVTSRGALPHDSTYTDALGRFRAARSARGPLNACLAFRMCRCPGLRDIGSYHVDLGHRRKEERPKIRLEQGDRTKGALRNVEHVSP